MWDLLITDTAGGGAIGVTGEHIAWAGPGDARPAGASAAVTWSVGGRVVTPGLVDCHTHLVFGGDRSAEWEQRLAGASLRGDRRRGRRHPGDGARPPGPRPTPSCSTRR